jgi:hypothetical protein
MGAFDFCCEACGATNSQDDLCDACWTDYYCQVEK